MAQKIITFANHKGGVSKTTSTASIGACMAMKGKKVLLIDLDGQANLTLYFIPNEDEIETSIFDSLVNGVPLPVKHIRENLDLVPSSLEMASAEIALTNLLAREQLLSRLLEPLRKDYDYILIDCPPSLGIVTTNAFIAADEIIVPMTPEPVSYTHLDVYKRQAPCRVANVLRYEWNVIFFVIPAERIHSFMGTWGQHLFKPLNTKPFFSGEYSICLLYTSRE